MKARAIRSEIAPSPSGLEEFERTKHFLTTGAGWCSIICFAQNKIIGVFTFLMNVRVSRTLKHCSPLTFIKNVKTPMMFILGEADYRTPPGAGGEEMFRALKFLKVPTVMVRFPNESHELSRSGQPWHRVERLQNIVGWFDRWLMGIPKPEYDVAPQEEVPGKKGNLPDKQPSPHHYR